MAPSKPFDPSPAAMIQRGLRLPQLRLLIAVADIGQISGAAAHIGMTQPAASRMLTELERATGATLYERHPRGVVLTDAGHLLARRARTALNDLETAFDEMQMLAQGAGGLVRIGTVTGPGLELVLPLIRDMRVTYPDINFEVLVDTSDVLADALFARRIDFYIGRTLSNVSPRDVTMTTIGIEPVALIVRSNHPLMRRPKVTLADTLVFDWVMQAPGGLLRLAVEAYLTEHGHPLPSRTLSTSSLLLTLGMISDTDVVAPVARSVADILVARDGMNSAISILDVGHDMAVSPYALICRRDSDNTPVVTRVLRMLHHRIGTRGQTDESPRPSR
ncbi:LysR family transcriptional regulator [Yoonia sp.]|uniref:LysR family transcriptional regulator n=1 Tax=Yoonia sp. TaxID=2212373 RepID=UPI003A4E18D6